MVCAAFSLATRVIGSTMPPVAKGSTMRIGLVG
jgi:hypothetical protein